MKKFISLITSAAALMAVVPMSAQAEEAADERTYSPIVYFTAEEKAPVIALASGNLYVNTSASSDKMITLPGQVLIKDKYKHVGQFTLKWLWDTDYVYTSGIKNPSAAGKTPAYEGYALKDGEEDPIMYYVEDGEKMMGISYGNTTLDPLKTTGENSDSNPVGVFDFNIDTSAPADYYKIHFNTEMPYITTIILRYGDVNFRGVKPSGEYAPSMTFAVTDRDLGDVNKDGTLDARDATAILSEYAKNSAGAKGAFDKAQSIAADVNGDEIIDGNDATKVLSYYAISSSVSFDDGVTLNDYVKGK
jgi:hypothetical protein